ncbi:MAG: hypothetical protein M1839_006253 [Geoglossum umbratile]|nr:MAG: hypothetical protein M1839_006253 [Geoglossum umbratile]
MVLRWLCHLSCSWVSVYPLSAIPEWFTRLRRATQISVESAISHMRESVVAVIKRQELRITRKPLPASVRDRESRFRHEMLQITGEVLNYQKQILKVLRWSAHLPRLPSEVPDKSVKDRKILVYDHLFHNSSL